jgi:hypothetical protein
VTQSYLRSRYGGQRELPAGERESLDRAWKPLRNGLIKKLFRIK